MGANKRDVDLPDRIKIIDKGSSIEIILRWFSLKIIVLTIFALFWDGFLFFYYSKILETGILFLQLLPVFHAAAGLLLTYYVIAGYFNKTFIKVNMSTISVKHFPLPFFGNKNIESRNIKQVYTKERIYHRSGSVSISYEVHILTHNNKDIKLLSGLDTGDQGLFIEQQIENYLRIKDETVQGEYNHLKR